MDNEVNKAIHVTNFLFHDKEENAIGLRQLVTECGANRERRAVFVAVNEF